MTFLDRRALAGLVLVASVACTDSTAPVRVAMPSPNLSVEAGDDDDAAGVSAFLAGVNRQAASAGVRVGYAEVLLTPEAPAKTPRILFANDRQLRLESKWVARDLRRLSTDATLSYGVFSPLAIATIGGPAEASFDATFGTWNAVSCSKLRVRKVAINRFPSFILGGGLFPPADINDVGFLPGAVFDAFLGIGASQFVIGVTFTFNFIQVGPGGVPLLDPNGNTIPTDIDRDGRDDTAFKEVWFNDALPYSTTGAPGFIDIESAALHEHGHALELGHFGKIVGDPNTGKLHVSPRAVMNAAILGTLRAPLGTDNAALCGNFGSWS